LAAQKGNKYSTGRPAGTKNEKTLQWEELGHSLLTRHSERANKILNECDDEVFMENYSKLLEYFKPKQARTEVKMEGDMEVTFTRKDATNPG